MTLMFETSLPLDTVSLMPMVGNINHHGHPALLIQAQEIHALRQLAPACARLLTDYHELDLTDAKDWGLLQQLECLLARQHHVTVKSTVLFWRKIQDNGKQIAREMLQFYRGLYQLILGSNNLLRCHKMFSDFNSNQIVIDFIKQQHAALNCYFSTLTFWSQCKWRSAIAVLNNVMLIKIEQCTRFAFQNETPKISNELLLLSYQTLSQMLRNTRSAVLMSSKIKDLVYIIASRVAEENAFTLEVKSNVTLSKLKKLLNDYVFQVETKQQSTLRARFRESYYALTQCAQLIQERARSAESLDEIKFYYELYWDLWVYAEDKKLQCLMQFYHLESRIEPLVLRTIVQSQLQGFHTIYTQIDHLLLLEIKNGQHADQPYIKQLRNVKEFVSKNIWLVSQLSHTEDLLPILKRELTSLRQHKTEPSSISRDKDLLDVNYDQEVRDFVLDMSATLTQIKPDA